MKLNTVQSLYGVWFLYQLGHSFFFATYVLFLMHAGLSFLECNLLNAVFMLSTAILEVPTGAIADRYGRKRSSLVGIGVMAVSMFWYFRSTGLIDFIVAEVACAFATACLSGAFEAWLIDSAGGPSSGNVIRKQNNLTLFGMLAGSLSGAYLGAVDLAWPWLAGGIVVSLSGAAALAVPEPAVPYSQAGVAGENWHRFRLDLKLAVKIKAVWIAAGLGLAFAFSVQATNMFWQPRFRDELGMAVENLGWLFVVILAASFIGNNFAARYLRSGRTFGGLVVALAVAGSGAIGAAADWHHLFILTSFLAHELGRGMYVPLMGGYLNDRIMSSTRATVVSAVSVAKYLGAAFGLAATGYIAQEWSVSTAWIISGLAAMLPIVWLRRNGREAR